MHVRTSTEWSIALCNSKLKPARPATSILPGSLSSLRIGSSRILRAQRRLFTPAAGDEAFAPGRQLIGVAHRPPRPIRQSREPARLVAIEDFAAGFPRNAELPAGIAHRFAVQRPGDKPKTFFHALTFLPRRRGLPRGQRGGGVAHASGTDCRPCLGPLTPGNVQKRPELA
jgi:hypothetical protein